MLSREMIVAIVLTMLGSVSLTADTPGDSSPLALFEERLMPIFRSSQPSSCVQCHLAGVDLKNYILPSHEKTFLSLRDQGLIDLKSPAKSKILTLIAMGDKDLDKGAKLIHAATRRAEHQAFAAWIKACCQDTRLCDLPPLKPAEVGKPQRDERLIRHARKSRVVDSFARTIWSQRMRCFPCHTPHEIDAENPKHQIAIKRQKEFTEKYGERMDVFRKTPEATLKHWLEISQRTRPGDYPMINLREPRKSLVILKPTSKLPQRGRDGKFAPFSSADPVTHMGGLKMHVDDPSYKSFVSWIQDYARVVGDRYVAVEDLPADNWYPSNHVLKLGKAPVAWVVGTPVQFFLHAWNEQDQSWQTEPLAFTQGTVTPRRRVNGALFLLAPDGSERKAEIDGQKVLTRPGKYLVKVYVDTRHRLSQDPAAFLGRQDYYGQIELVVDDWREGFRNGKLISGEQLIHE